MSMDGWRLVYSIGRLLFHDTDTTMNPLNPSVASMAHVPADDKFGCTDCAILSLAFKLKINADSQAGQGNSLGQSE
jgi:hypothetical protein